MVVECILGYLLIGAIIGCCCILHPEGRKIFESMLDDDTPEWMAMIAVITTQSILWLPMAVFSFGKKSK